MGNTNTAEYIAGEMIATIIHDNDLLDMEREKVAREHGMQYYEDKASKESGVEHE